MFSNLYQNDNQKEHENIAKNIIRKTDKEHLGLGNQKEDELTAIYNMQQNLILLIGSAVMGFDSYKLNEKEINGSSTFYFSKANPLMMSKEEVIEKLGTKTNYIAAYRTKQMRDLSFKAFLALPFVNKSSIPLKLEEDKSVSAPDLVQYNMYMSDKLVASYAKFLKQELSVIKIYQLNF